MTPDQIRIAALNEGIRLAPGQTLPPEWFGQWAQSNDVNAWQPTTPIGGIDIPPANMGDPYRWNYGPGSMSVGGTSISDFGSGASNVGFGPLPWSGANYGNPYGYGGGPSIQTPTVPYDPGYVGGNVSVGGNDIGNFTNNSWDFGGYSLPQNDPFGGVSGSGSLGSPYAYDPGAYGSVGASLYPYADPSPIPIGDQGSASVGGTDISGFGGNFDLGGSLPQNDPFGGVSGQGSLSLSDGGIDVSGNVMSGVSGDVTIGSGQQDQPIVTPDGMALPTYGNTSTSGWPVQMPGGVGTMQQPAYYYTGVGGSFNQPLTQSQANQQMSNLSITSNFAGGIAGLTGLANPIAYGGSGTGQNMSSMVGTAMDPSGWGSSFTGGLGATGAPDPGLVGGNWKTDAAYYNYFDSLPNPVLPPNYNIWSGTNTNNPQKSK